MPAAVTGRISLAWPCDQDGKGNPTLAGTWGWPPQVFSAPVRTESFGRAPHIHPALGARHLVGTCDRRLHRREIFEGSPAVVFGSIFISRIHSTRYCETFPAWRGEPRQIDSTADYCRTLPFRPAAFSSAYMTAAPPRQVPALPLAFRGP